MPEASARALQPGGTTVVVSSWKTTAGPAIASPSGSRLAVVEAGRKRPQRAVDPEDAVALADERLVEGRRSATGSASSVGRPPIAVTRTLTISIGSP